MRQCQLRHRFEPAYARRTEPSAQMAEDRLVVVGQLLARQLEVERRNVTELLARQLEVERLTGELTPGARCLTVGVAHALATRPNPIPAVGMVVPPHVESRRHSVAPRQLRYEDIAGPWAPSMRLQQKVVHQLGQVGVSLIEVVAEAMRFTWPEVEYTWEEEEELINQVIAADAARLNEALSTGETPPSLLAEAWRARARRKQFELLQMRRSGTDPPAEDVEAASSSSGVATYVAPAEVQRQQDVQRLLVRQAEEREELEQRRLVTRELERAARPQRLRRPSDWLQQRYP